MHQSLWMGLGNSFLRIPSSIHSFIHFPHSLCSCVLGLSQPWQALLLVPLLDGLLVLWASPSILLPLSGSCSRRQLQIPHPLGLGAGGGQGPALRCVKFLSVKCPWNRFCLLMPKLCFNITSVSYYENILNISVSTLLRLLML